MRYRRANAPGATYFITANLADRGSRLLVEHIDAFRSSLRAVRARHPYLIDAIVILNDHFHVLMTLPEGDAGFSMRIGSIKSGFSRQVPTVETINASRLEKRERGVWQRRFWEHLIRDDDDFAHHVDYIHINPVKHGLVTRASDWPHSSIHRYIQHGIVSADWAGGEADGEFGER